MSAVLIDSSVWLAARDRDDRFHQSATRLIMAAADGAVAAAGLDLTLYEVANVAAVRWRSPIEAERLVSLVLSVVGDRLVRVDDVLAAAAVAVSTQQRITVYDAAYVACADARAWSLVSTDLSDLVEPGHAVTPEEFPG